MPVKKRRSVGAANRGKRQKVGASTPSAAPAAGAVLSTRDKSSLVALSKANTAATCKGGFASVRGSKGTSSPGMWYFEVKVKLPKSDSHCSSHRAEINVPVGFDSHGYGYRDINGAKIHCGRRMYYGDSFGDGDVIGCLLHLNANLRREDCQYANLLQGKTPEGENPAEGVSEEEAPAPQPGANGDDGSDTKDEKQATKGKASLTGDAATGGQREGEKGITGTPAEDGEEEDEEDEEELAGVEVKNYIKFFKNGVDQGVAFVNIAVSPGQPLFPTISLYGGATAIFNGGPTWDFPPDVPETVRMLMKERTSQTSLKRAGRNKKAKPPTNDGVLRGFDYFYEDDASKKSKTPPSEAAAAGE